MKSFRSVCLLLPAFLPSIGSEAEARDLPWKPYTTARFYAHPANDGDQGKLDNLFAASQIDTFVLGEYDFDSLSGCSLDGWATRDATAQLFKFWHVANDTNAACIPSNVMWCGQEPSSDIAFCSWSDPTGYGNDWIQYLCTKPFSFSGTITWTFRIAWDTEIAFDFVFLQYDSAGAWVDRLVLDGQSGDSSACYEEMTLEMTPVGLSKTKLRFSFTSDGAFSDEDGFDPSEWGALAVDNVLVTDGSGTVVPFEDFEDETGGVRGVGDDFAMEAGDTTWFAKVNEPVGNFVGVDIGLFEEDPCRDNLTCQLHFYNNSTLTDPLYPGTFVTPRDINNVIISPTMDWDQGGIIPSLAAQTVFHYEVYRDLPLGGSVFYTWAVRTYSTLDPTCPGLWKDRNFVYFGPERDFLTVNEDVTDLIEPNPDAIQVRVGVVDLCDPFCIQFGYPGTPHTPSPTFDNISVYRTSVTGPAWGFVGNQFNDTFPEDGSLTGIGRIDGSDDVAEEGDPSFIPSDHMSFPVAAPQEGGLAAHPRAYVRVASGPHAGLTGASIAGNAGGTFVGVVDGWTCIEADSGHIFGVLVPGYWDLDLNDSLFVAGDVIEYFFSATTALGNSGTLPEDTSGGNFFEVSILPTAGRDILFVPVVFGRPVPYFRTALEQAGFGDKYDRFDGGFTTGLDVWIKALSQIQVYKKIIWAQGFGISDGTVGKSDNVSLLRDYLNLTPHDVGLWVTGDDVGFQVSNSTTPAALELLTSWCGVSVVAESQFDFTGLAIPTIHAETGSPWDGVVSCSTLVADGGCPVINSFDVLETNAGSKYAFTWPGHNPGVGDPRGAVITNAQVNSVGGVARTIWQGYGFHLIRDDVPSPLLDRTSFLQQAMLFLGNTPGIPTAAKSLPASYALAQNHPNPFNPVTKIDYALPRAGDMKLVIYNVAGKRVKTLYNGFARAGYGSAIWDGTNDVGRQVTSGVYFYRITAQGFTDQKKMVLLK